MCMKELDWIEETDLGKYDLSSAELTAAILLRGKLASLKKGDAAVLMKRIAPDDVDRDELIVTLSEIADGAISQIALKRQNGIITNRMGYYMNHAAVDLSAVDFAVLKTSASPDFIRFLKDLRDSF